MTSSLMFTHLKITVAIPVFRFLSKLSFLQNVAPTSGLARLVRIQKLEDVKHESIHPFATYAPWKSDPEFLTFFDQVRDFTLVDIYRCYELWRLVGESAKAGAGDILEVGVWRGGTGAILAKRAQLLGLNSKVFLADTFEGVVKAGARDTNYAGGEHADTSEAKVRTLCSNLKLNAVVIAKGIFPEDRPKEMDAQKFRLCHIDTDTYDSAKGVFDWVWPRTVVGGIIIFDDFGFYNCTGVTRLVEELRQQPDLVFIHNLNGHGVFVKVR